MFSLVGLWQFRRGTYTCKFEKQAIHLHIQTQTNSLLCNPKMESFISFICLFESYLGYLHATCQCRDAQRWFVRPGPRCPWGSRGPPAPYSTHQLTLFCPLREGSSTPHSSAHRECWPGDKCPKTASGGPARAKREWRGEAKTQSLCPTITHH